MTPLSTEEIVRQVFHAYEHGDSETLHGLLADGFKFSAPADPKLDKDGYIRRCWPFHEQKPCYNFEEFFVRGDRAMVLYLCTTQGGKKIRNAEYFHVLNGAVVEICVFFGPELDELARESTSRM